MIPQHLQGLYDDRHFQGHFFCDFWVSSAGKVVGSGNTANISKTKSLLTWPYIFLSTKTDNTLINK